ncbi:MAG: potassium-transporting ATPase potassium-binding subunit [Bacteroidota bacterium]|nr:potassium-transporting ATPase potassium-binding subunit [Bacteroidota bacterium]
MQTGDYIQIGLYFAALIFLTKPLGLYIYNVLSGNGKNAFVRKTEFAVFKLCGINPDKQDNWKSYTFSMLLFNGAGFLFVFIIQLIQQYLPLNPQNLSNVEPYLSFNTAVSFMTNTNWQSYSGETTLSYFIQMTGLTVQNFLSAATGLTIFLAITKGIISRSSSNLGNFFADLTRSTLFILLPLSIILAVILVSQGVVQNFSSYINVNTLEGYKQVLPMGPAASQIAIKQLGTNGGGFFNVNSAFPFENPNAITNFLEMLSILLIPAALTYTFGKLIGSKRDGWIIFSVMMGILIIGLAVSLNSEFSANNILGTNLNLEGKETRFGITNSIIWSTATTAASNGSVNAMHDSLMPLSGLVALFNIMTGEVVFGGVGAGMYGMIIFIILTVFISGLMIGRTPEYLGKKIQSKEVQMAIVAIIAPSFAILAFSAIAVSISQGLSSLNNTGPHGLSEILYAFSSAAGNNGSAFAGLNANTPFYNIMLGIGMLIGRFAVIIPVMVIAGSLADKKITPLSAGTFRTDNALFGFLLFGIIIIIGALTFLPALFLGPVAEHLLM